MIIITIYLLVTTGHFKPRTTRKILDRLHYPIPNRSTENIDELTQMAQHAVREWSERNPHIRIAHVHAHIDLSIELNLTMQTNQTEN